MKTTLKNTKICIEKLNFDSAGKISLKLEDGRVIIVPLKYFLLYHNLKRHHGVYQ